MSPEMFLSAPTWNPRLILDPTLRSSSETQDQDTKMTRHRTNWSFSSRNWHKSRTISARPTLYSDCTTVMSLVISVCFVSLLFCYGVTDGRPQKNRNYLQDASSVKSRGASAASFVSSEDETRPDQVTHHELDPDLLKLREVMLMELGLIEAAKNASYTLPKEEISREEYIRAYAEYMSNVRNRRLAEKSTINALTQRERRKKFRKTVQFFDNLNKGTNQTTFDSAKEAVFERQLMFDINFSHYYDTAEVRVRQATLYLPTGCYLREDNSIDDQRAVEQVDITNNVTYWINHAKGSSHHSFIVTAECLSSASAVAGSTGNSNGYIKVEAKLASKEELRNRRSKRAVVREKIVGVRDLLSRGKAKDCSETRHGRTCCRKPLRVDFEDLGIKDLIHEPKAFEAYMCSGRCNAAKRVAYASTHALIQQTLHKALNKDPDRDRVQKPCCAPMELGSLDVIHTVPGEHRLEVTTIHDAIVLRCGCS